MAEYAALFELFERCLGTAWLPFLLYRFGVIFECLSFCNGRKYQHLYSMITDNEQRQVFCFGAVFTPIFLCFDRQIS